MKKTKVSFPRAPRLGFRHASHYGTWQESSAYWPKPYPDFPSSIWSQPKLRVRAFVRNDSVIMAELQAYKVVKYVCFGLEDHEWAWVVISFWRSDEPSNPPISPNPALRQMVEQA